MGEQRRITEFCDLLDFNGHLINPGYATKPLWKYNRQMIRASRFRIKEWDYYAVLAPERGYGITFTLADLGYIGLAAVCWLDFQKCSFKQVDTLSILPMGRMNFPTTSDSGAIQFEDKKLSLQFEVSSENRRIRFDVPDFENSEGQKGLKGELNMQQDPDMESMVIATSWKENRKAFYYNHKINCMPVEGNALIGTQKYDFSPTTSFGTLDWGRGNWTYRNRWYWGSASGLLNGESFGWNIGYGFSDRSLASENMLFYQNKAHKLDEVTFQFDERDYMKPWKFLSNDNRFEMDFVPLVDRNSKTDFKMIKSVQHQVFGHFTGRVTLDNGKVLEVKDFLGFAEDVYNAW